MMQALNTMDATTRPELAVPEQAIAEKRRKGRGAGANPSSRFDTIKRLQSDDGWDIEEELPPFKTEVMNEQARRIITRNTSPDIGFDQSINAYRGCEHGCIYCYARPSHAYLGLSPGLDFEHKLTAKPNAAEQLKLELSAPSYEPKTIAMGTNTDPYQPIEKDRKITRNLLQVLSDAHHPVTIATKSALIMRDMDILSSMAERNLVKVFLSITTLDKEIARGMEPRAATPKRRLDAIRTLASAGIPTGVMAAPIIPGLTDHELEAILSSAHAAGATAASYILLRLPLEVSPLFREWLLRKHPGRYRHVMSLVRSMRGGQDYDTRFNVRMKGEGPYAETLAKRFELQCKRLRLERRNHRLRTDLFQPPYPPAQQLSLL